MAAGAVTVVACVVLATGGAVTVVAVGAWVVLATGGAVTVVAVGAWVVLATGGAVSVVAVGACVALATRDLPLRKSHITAAVSTPPDPPSLKGHPSPDLQGKA